MAASSRPDRDGKSDCCLRRAGDNITTSPPGRVVRALLTGPTANYSLTCNHHLRSMRARSRGELQSGSNAAGSSTACFGATQLVHLAHYLSRCVDALPRPEGPSARRVSANEPIASPIGEQLIGVLLAWLGKTALLVGVLDIRNARVRLTERTR